MTKEAWTIHYRAERKAARKALTSSPFHRLARRVMQTHAWPRWAQGMALLRQIHAEEAVKLAAIAAASDKMDSIKAHRTWR